IFSRSIRRKSSHSSPLSPEPPLPPARSPEKRPFCPKKNEAETRLSRRKRPKETPMAALDSDSILLSPSEHQIQLRRAIIASTVGTAIEWYDFFLYSTVTGLVFAKLFFPHSDPWVGTLEAFAIYAVGFIARPIGAAIFGHYGDRIGR